MGGEWIAFGDAASRFLFANWILQSSCLLGAALLVARIARMRPGTRHAVLAASLLVSALSPTLQLLPLPGRLQLEPPEAIRGTVASNGVTASREPAVRHPEGRPLPPSTATPPVDFPVGWLLLFVWMSIAGTRLLILAHGAGLVLSWRRRAVPVDPTGLYAACRWRLADVQVLESDEVAGPSAVGIRRPCILLPRGLAAALDAESLRHVLLHEEAHLRRRDPLVLLLAELCHALLFWHPLAEYARRELEGAAEDACDARVLAAGVSGAGYARTLVAVMEQSSQGLLAPRPRAASPFGDSSRELRRRVDRVLGAPPRPSRVLSGLSLAALSVLVMASAAARLGSPPALPARSRPAAAVPRVAHRAPPPAAAAPRSTHPTPLPSEVGSRLSAPLAAPVSLLAGRSAEKSRGGPRTLGTPGEGPLLADPSAPTPREGRCLVYVLDNSHGMRPYQADARHEILGRIGGLGPADRFNVIVFNTEVFRFADEPVSADQDSRQQLRTWLAEFPYGEGSNLEAGLVCAFGTAGVTSVVLFSDGQPTQGVTDRGDLIALLDRENQARARVVAVRPPAATGIVGESLLTTVAERSGGEVRTLQSAGPEPGE